MTLQTNWTSVGLLGTAGVAPAAYADELYLAAEQKQLIVPLVAEKPADPGQDLFIPKLGLSTAVTRYSNLTTDGTTYSVTTSEGQDLTYEALDDSPVQFMEKFQYVAMAYDKIAWNRMAIPKRLSFINGWKKQASGALARAGDASILSLALPALIPSANQINSAAAAHFTFDDIGTVLKLLKKNNGDGEFIGVLHSDEIPYLINTPQLTQFMWTGRSDSVRKDLVFVYGPLTIFTHNDVYDDAVDGFHGMFFSRDAVGYRSRSTMSMDDWYDPNTKSYKTSPDIDYCYGAKETSLIVTLQTPRS